MASMTKQTHVGLTLFALATGGFAIGTTEFATMSLLPQLAHGLAVSETAATHVISAYALGVVVGAPTIAVLGARLPRRAMLIGLMIVFSVANALSAFAPTLGWMLVFRFLSGLPHGAFFGIGALMAASVVPRARRTQAVGRMMLGLTVATIAGVPFANLLGQLLNWRWGFGVVAFLSLATALLLRLYAPAIAADRAAKPMRELRALTKLQVWLTLLTGAIGFGGLFAVYTFLASTATEVTGLSPRGVPGVFALFGVGMTLGTLVCAWAADRALMAAAGATLAFGAAALACYAPATHHMWPMLAVVTLIGASGGLGTVLQARLMDVAGDAQTLAAALNHSAFNTANALGPWLAGLVVAGGYGLPATGWVGVALSLGGLAVWAVSFTLDRRRAG